MKQQNKNPKQAGMSRIIQPYLFFEGRCDEALDFYVKALDAEVTSLMRYSESPDPSEMHGHENKVMHASIRIGETEILASDGQCSGNPAFQSFGLALSVNTEADADRFFNALSDGGKVQMPLEKTFFSPKFGMVSDRFGILWMILTVSKPA
jgi:PhnB protein